MNGFDDDACPSASAFPHPTTLYRCCYSYYYFCLKPTSTKPQAEILTLNQVNGCNDVSFGDHGVLEGDRIPPLKGRGQALEEELMFPWCP